MSEQGRVVGPEGIVSFESPAGEPVVVRASGDESGGTYDILELTVPPGPGVTPMHIHHEMDEAMYVLEGEVTVQLEDHRHTLTPGSYVRAPRGMAHTYRNPGETPARVLFINTPGDNWHYLEEAAQYGPVEDQSDVERILPILASHGVEIVGPPLEDSADGVS